MMGHNVIELDEFANPFRDHGVRPRVDICGLTVRDVVTNVGGWMCDRVLTGWDVAVNLIEPGDTTPLRILGVCGFGRDSREWSRRSTGGRGPRNAIAVSAKALALDSDAQEDVRRILCRGGTDVVVWGDSPDGLDSISKPQQYVMSCAAAAFKREALTAVAARLEHVEPIENLYFLGALGVGSAVEASTSVPFVSPRLRIHRV